MMINHRRPIYLLVATLLMVALYGSRKVSVAQLDPSSRLPYMPSEQYPEVYLPYVANQYDWLSLDEWTPWAFQEHFIRGLYSGPEPGWIWILSYEGLFRSKNNGLSWERVDHDLPGIPSDLAVRKGTFSDHAIYTISRGNIYVSTDGGENWEPNGDLTASFNFVKYVNSIPYATTSYPHQVYSQLTRGNWTTVGDELVAPVKDLAQYQSVLYVGTTDGLYRLINNAWQPVTISEYGNIVRDPTTGFDSWLQSSVELPAPSAVSSSAVNSIAVYSDTLYIGTGGARGVYRSDDGVSWTARDTGLIGPYNHYVTSLAFSESGRLFAAGMDGVFASDIFGDRWQSLDIGLPHTNTGYGVLLDGITGTSLVLVRDEEGEQTLAAVFNGQGLWFHTVTNETLYQDQPPLNPPKAVLVVGPFDPPNHNATKSYIAWADRLANIMSQNGMDVIKVYWPNSTWEDVRPALSGASIVVYKGHGFAWGGLSEDPTDMLGGLNGFTLVHPMDPLGARLGTQDMLVTTNRLAENAIVFFFCSYCAGSSGGDSSPVPLEVARRRIETYSSTSLYMGGSGYFASVYEESLLEDFFDHPDMTLGELYMSVGGAPDHIYPHILWPELSVWFDGNMQQGWSRAFVGNPNLTARDILGH